MNLIRAIVAGLVTASCGAAFAVSGPVFHTSDGVTDASQLGACLPLTNCVLQTDSAITEWEQTSTSRFYLYTGPSVSVDHFAIGVRGDPVDRVCGTGTIPLPFLGRGLAIYPIGFNGSSTPTLLFENFTMACSGAGGLALSTARPMPFAPNSRYFFQVAADANNVWYTIWRWTGVGNEWVIQSSGDCLASAVGLQDQRRCAAGKLDKPNAGRAFILSTSPLAWEVAHWYLW